MKSSFSKKKMLIVVPAYNEAGSIGNVLSSIREELPNVDMLVVNDGSKDQTGNIARESGCLVIDHPFNMGIGATMQTGYRYAAMMGYDVACQLDGDGQHPADQLERIIGPVLQGDADVVIGSRFLGEGDYVPSLARSVGIRVFASILSVITGERVTDPTSGFRAVSRDVISFYARKYPEDYPEVEAIVLLHKAGFRIMETPVRMEARVWGKSSITYIQAFYYMVKVSLAVFVDLIKKVEK